MSGIIHTFYNTVQIMIFDRIKTQNPFIDTILTTLFMYLVGYALTFIQQVSCFDQICNADLLNNVVELLRRPNKIKISGKTCTNATAYGDFSVSAAYSDGFNAILDYIINNIDKTDNISEIKELFSNNNKDKATTQFVVSQTREFFIDPNIYIRIINKKEDCEDSGKKQFQIENIVIEIFSYRFTLQELKQYFDNILSNYKISIQTERNNKKFVYSVDKMFLKEDECHLNRWREAEYKSNRTFENLFFERKEDIIKKIDFFLNNKSWYDEKGIPYNLGIGLHGPPGTGKTSFIKALANKTNRDIVIIPLKLIKTISQLKEIFFEETYSRLNETGSRTFDKKIIVFEDIDCIGDIVKDRTLTEDTIKINIQNKPSTSDDDDAVFVNNTVTRKKPNEKMINEMLQFLDPITLDDFLNLWDGVRETPGRIIVITSNFYNRLDPALIRPGRIDIGYELSNVSHTIMQEMHQHFFKKEMNKEDLSKIQTLFYSPAELVNIYLSSDFLETNYLNRLKENKKV